MLFFGLGFTQLRGKHIFNIFFQVSIDQCCLHFPLHWPDLESLKGKWHNVPSSDWSMNYMFLTHIVPYDPLKVVENLIAPLSWCAMEMPWAQSVDGYIYWNKSTSNAGPRGQYHNDTLSETSMYNHQDAILSLSMNAITRKEPHSPSSCCCEISQLWTDSEIGGQLWKVGIAPQKISCCPSTIHEQIATLLPYDAPPLEK